MGWWDSHLHAFRVANPSHGDRDLIGIPDEDRFEGEPKQKYPRCLAGERKCPPEDCGGPWGYENMLKILADSDHEEHDGMLTWVGGS